MIKSAWIGYADKDTEGTWVWVPTGKEEPKNTYKNWKDGEPGKDGEDKDCASMNDADGKWVDQGCDMERNAFFCGFSKYVLLLG